MGMVLTGIAVAIAKDAGWKEASILCLMASIW
jgi:hypothetical protein